MQTMPTAHPPVVLTIAGHDPTGGAGIQADMEAIAANGCHAASAVTCLTVQDTRNVQRLVPVDGDLLEQQIRVLLDDLPVAVIKIGLIGDAAITRRLGRLLGDLPLLPVVLDPILAAGGGSELGSKELQAAIREQLLPNTTLLTPNSVEARRLGGSNELEASARQLLRLGCTNVLITGTHEQGDEVINRLYTDNEEEISWSWPRLNGSYHGSGCTLAAAIAAQLAHGLPIHQAVEKGQAYTWQSLVHAYRPGRGQTLPDRFHAMRPKSCKQLHSVSTTACEI